MAADNKQLNSLSSNEQELKGPIQADARLITALYHAYLGRSPDPQDVEVYQGLDASMVSKLVADRAKTEEKMREQIQGSPISEGGASDGVGGAAPTIPMGSQIIDYGREGWYFPQDTVLVQFQSGSEPTPGDTQTGYKTIWLYNKNNNTLVPFQTESSFNKFFEGQFNLQQAEQGKQINRLDSSVLVTPNNPFYRANTLKFSEGIDGAGNMPMTTQLKWAYGQKTDNAKNDLAYNHIVNFMELLKKDNAVGISSSLIDQTLKDKNKMAQYQNAYIYGGYSIGDIFKDLKAKQMSINGYKDYDKIQAFDPINRAEVFYNTAAAKRAYADSQLNMPTTVAGINSKALEDSAFFQEQGFYKAPFSESQVNPNSPEFKKAMEEIDAQMYDTAMKQIQAKTEREKAIADDNWRMVKESLEKRYQVSLSNNAFEAWAQLKQIFANMSQRGLGASGIENEAVDATLAAARREDENLRWTKKQELYEQRRNYYVNSASPEQIANDLTAEERAAWGLSPTADIAKYFDKANLKTMFPNLTDEEIDQIRANALDEYGNYRTPNYQELRDTLYELGEKKKDFQFGQALLQAVYGLEKSDLEYDPENLSKYGSEYGAAADEQRGAFLTQKPSDSYYQNELAKGWHIPGIKELKEIQADLAKKGIPSSKWGDYVVKEADGKSLTYYPLGKNYIAPNTNIPKPYTAYDPATGKRVAVDYSGKIANSVRTMPAGYKVEIASPKNAIIQNTIASTTPTKAYTAYDPTSGKRVAVDPTGVIKNSVKTMPTGYKVELKSPAATIAPTIKNTAVQQVVRNTATPAPVIKPTVAATYYDPATGRRVAVDPTGKIKGSVTSIPTGYKLETNAPKLKSVFTK